MRKTALIILDGWGHGKEDDSNAIHLANTPFMDSLYKKYPNAELITYGEEVGLPAGQMGNSEVGHLNIGAGRIVYQDFQRINKVIADNLLGANPQLQACFKYCLSRKRPLHLMGLVSQGGVHSHQEHLFEIMRLAKLSGINEIFVHAFTDGRDCDPKSALEDFKVLEAKCLEYGAKVATVSGRYYAMDRDNRWERIAKAYNAMVHSKGETAPSSIACIENSYQNGVTDEFILPTVIVEEGKVIGQMDEGDAVLCFNFRTDRCREITIALTQKDIPSHQMEKLNLEYFTMTRYDKNFESVEVLFEKDNLTNTLGEWLSKNNKTQIRIAETEKYPHVTFFFSGGREEPFMDEERVLCASPKVATYDLKPEMSAPCISEKIVEKIKNDPSDFICLNFANPDMVGHTGVPEAVIKAVETVDLKLEKIVNEGLKQDYSFLIIADHGNADCIKNPDGSPHTAHTLNPVPVICIHPKVKKVENGKLADVAPTILHMMGIPPAPEMTGNVLIS
jgi:2,3-bisphosphoglycerate-independent phosphoglycerate mutase